MKNEFLSVEPVSGEFLARLRLDLQRAEILRFVVAYVSKDGLDGIGYPLLLNALAHPKSFGVSSLTCRFGHEPLLALQRTLEYDAAPRVKYFMEVGDTDRVRLMHDKLIYIGQPECGRAVVYVGSHNWTSPALGLGITRNAEASVRIETDFSEAELHGSGTGLMAGVQQHLMKCFNYPLCIPATNANINLFEEWRNNVCEGPPSRPLEQIGIVLAVHHGAGSRATTAVVWEQCRGKSLYLQCLDGEDGRHLRNVRPTILVFVWESREALSRAAQPVILICRESTSYAGPDSEVRGSNISDNVIEGFCAAVLDVQQLSNKQQGNPPGPPQRIYLPTGRAAEYFDFQLPAQASNTRDINKSVRPSYQFHLEVEDVALPDSDSGPQHGALLWPRSSFAVAQTRSAEYYRSPGYQVEPEVAHEILACLKGEFGLDVKKAKAIPYSSWDDPRVGRRVAAHPFHESYLPVFHRSAGSRSANQEWIERDHYSKVPKEFVAAEIAADQYERELPHPVSRVFLAHAVPIDELRAFWQRITDFAEGH